MASTLPENLVHALPLFAGLADSERETLLKPGKARRFQAGQNLFYYGDTISAFYVICDGAVQLSRETPDGHEMTAEVLIAGDTIGETEIFQVNKTRQFTALAIKDTTILEFPLSWLKEAAKKHSALALNLLSVLSRRLRTATLEAEQKATMTAAQQVACFLERLCILYDFDPHGFDLPYSKTLIASRLGMELETFSRALAKIREHGVTVQGTRVAFDDLRKMEDFVCGNCSLAGDCAEHEQLRAELRKSKSSQTR